jgi:hypothetical protein
MLLFEHRHRASARISELQETESSIGYADYRPRKSLPSRRQIPSSELSLGCGGALHPSPLKLRRAYARLRCEVFELQGFIAPFLDVTAHLPNYIRLVPT